MNTSEYKRETSVCGSSTINAWLGGCQPLPATQQGSASRLAMVPPLAYRMAGATLDYVSLNLSLRTLLKLPSHVRTSHNSIYTQYIHPTLIHTGVH